MEQPIRTCLEVLNLMMESEQTVGEFYRLCSEEFVDNQAFWASLAKQELAHSEVIRKLIQLVRIHPSEFTAGKSTPVPALNAFIARTKSGTESLRRGKLPEEKALLTAYQIEKTIIELRYADVVNTKNENYNALLSQVISDTLQHQEIVVDRNKVLSEQTRLRKKPS